jgi:hypothetical protein
MVDDDDRPDVGSRMDNSRRATVPTTMVLVVTISS